MGIDIPFFPRSVQNTKKRDHFLRNHNTFLLKHNNKEDDKEEVWHESLDCHFVLFSGG